MMKNKQTLYAFVALIGLVLIYWLTLGGEVDTKSVKTYVFTFNSDDVIHVDVKTPDDEFAFTLKGDQWDLDGYAVDSSRMKSFLSTISALEADRLITRKDEKHSQYEVDAQGTQMSFKTTSDELLASFIIGKQGSNYLETFVRGLDESPVYAVLSNLSRYRNMKQADFWDKTITELRVDELVDVQFSGELNFNLHREGPVWSFNGEQVDFEKVQSMLKSLENLRASNFVDDISADKVWYQSIQLTLESGDPIELKFYLKDENASTLLLDASTKSKKFEYPKSGLNRFKKTLDDLKSEPVN